MLHPAPEVAGQTTIQLATPLTSPAPGRGQPPALPTSTERLVLALYYPWYTNDTWSDPVLSDRPRVPYHSSDPTTIRQHVQLARGAGIEVLVSAWFGPAGNNPTETNLRTLLDTAREHGMRVSLLLETDSDDFFRSTSDLQVALAHALSVHARHPAFLRVGDRPVLFIWRPRSIFSQGERVNRDDQRSLAAWRELREAVDPARGALWIAETETTLYLDVFDGMFPYSVAWASDPAAQLMRWGQAVRDYNARHGANRLWIATVMPGYDDTGLTDRRDRFKVDREGGAYYARTFAGAIASRPDWINISSFNEWVEGHQIEPSETYGNLYLDLTRELVSGWKNAP